MSPAMSVLLGLLILLFPLVILGSLELAKSRKQKAEREIARRRWEAERRELNIQQLERENADFEGWLEALHRESDQIETLQVFWDELTQKRRTALAPPPYRPDRSLITYIERRQK